MALLKLWGKTLLSFLRNSESGLVSQDSELYLPEVKALAQNDKYLLQAPHNTSKSQIYLTVDIIPI